jgi:hypothetical protein
LEVAARMACRPHCERHRPLAVAWQFWTTPSDQVGLLRRLQARRCGETGGRLWKTAEVDHRIPLFRVWRVSVDRQSGAGLLKQYSPLSLRHRLDRRSWKHRGHPVQSASYAPDGPLCFRWVNCAGVRKVRLRRRVHRPREDHFVSGQQLARRGRTVSSARARAVKVHAEKAHRSRGGSPAIWYGHTPFGDEQSPLTRLNHPPTIRLDVLGMA